MSTLRKDNASLASTIDDCRQRQFRLEAWIEALHDHLYRFDAAAVAHFRSRYGENGSIQTVSQSAVSAENGGKQLNTGSRTAAPDTVGVELLGTLANAASVHRPPISQMLNGTAHSHPSSHFMSSYSSGPSSTGSSFVQTPLSDSSTLPLPLPMPPPQQGWSQAHIPQSSNNQVGQKRTWIRYVWLSIHRLTRSTFLPSVNAS